MSAGIVFHSLAALAYAILAISLWRPLVQGGEKAQAGKVGRVCLLGAIVLHGIGLASAIVLPNGLHLGWALALSAAFWLGLIVFWLESLAIRIDGLLLILLPAATLVSALAAFFPNGPVLAHGNSQLLRLHLLIALVAYGLITVAAFQAMLMAALDRYLHRPVEQMSERNFMSRALDSMPSLLYHEHLLFRVIWIGFAILTLTVLSGMVVSMRFSGVLLPMDHKTVFTLLSWLTFGVLLVGRHLKGWRGRIALRWTIFGFAFLLLSYTGSHFVIDVILQRG